jgi:hypothetical protein
VFCLVTVFTCFVCFWESLKIISLNSITRLVLSLEMHCVFFEVGSKSLKIIWKHIMVQSVNQ